MDPISNADRLVILLRQKLKERAQAGGARRAAKPAETAAAATAPAAGIKAVLGVEGVEERFLRRTLIQNLLADQFGPGLVNDAKFQQIVSRVTETIEEDPAAAQLLSELLSDLRAS